MFWSCDGGSAYVYHNTLVDCVYGMNRHFDIDITATNNAAFNNTTADYQATGYNAASTNNGYTSGGAGPTGGSNAIDLGDSAANLFSGPAGKNYRIAGSGSPAFRVGADLRNDPNLPIKKDIVGNLRSSTPCIGAHELKVGPGGLLLPYKPRYKMRPQRKGYFISQRWK